MGTGVSIAAQYIGTMKTPHTAKVQNLDYLVCQQHLSHRKTHCQNGSSKH